MKGLLLKDWYQFIKHGKFFLIFNVIYAILAAANMSMFLVLFNVIFNCMIVKTLMAYEEQNHWERLLMNLPVTKAEVIWEKYVVGILAMLAANIISFGVLTAAKLAGVLAKDVELMPYFILFFSVGALYLSAELSILFHFGVNEGRMWFILATGIICGIGGGSSAWLMENVGRLASGRYVIWGISLGAFVLAVIAVLCSGKLSLYLYKRKEV